MQSATKDTVCPACKGKKTTSDGKRCPRCGGTGKGGIRTK